MLHRTCVIGQYLFIRKGRSWSRWETHREKIAGKSDWPPELDQGDVEFKVEGVEAWMSDYMTNLNLQRLSVKVIEV